MSSVYSRLKAIQRNSEKIVRTKQSEVIKANIDKISPNTISDTPEPTESQWNQPIEGIWYRKKTIPLQVSLQSIHSFLVASGINQPLDKVFWFDTETTGLSGGAGTIIFLFGWVRWNNTAWELHQVLLRDYSYEPEFWDFILENLKEMKVLISYNGLAYDQPLVLSRCILNGFVFTPPEHVDLLFPVRRLWKNLLPTCSLSAVEQYILYISRLKDIPGSLIPQEYFSYLRIGSPSPDHYSAMDLIVSHHEMDHWSMILTTDVLGKVYSALNQSNLNLPLADLHIPFLSVAGLLKTAKKMNLLSVSQISRILSDSYLKKQALQASDLLQISRSYYQLGEMKDGIEFFIQLLQMQPSIWALNRVVIWLERNQHDYQGAMEYLNLYEDVWKSLPEKPRALWQKRYKRLREKVKV